MMMFLLLMVFSVVHLSMLAATKFIVNYSAFAAARSAMVSGTANTHAAAQEVLWNLRWWRTQNKNGPDGPPIYESRYGRSGVTIVYRVPLGLPMFNQVPAGGLRVVGFSPMIDAATLNGSVQMKGDNCCP